MSVFAAVIVTMASPVSLDLSSPSPTSLAALRDPWIAGIAFTALAGLALLHSVFSDVTKRWYSLTLALLLALPYMGFWRIGLPYGVQDEWMILGVVVDLERHGMLPSKSFLYYLFPGFPMWIRTATAVTGLSYFEIASVLVLALIFTFTAVWFLFFEQVLKSHTLSLLGVFLMLNSVVWSLSLHPAYLGFLLVFITLWLVMPRRTSVTLANRVCLLTIFSLLTISYLPGAAIVLMVMAGIVATKLARLLQRRQEGSNDAIGVEVLSAVGCLAIFAGWMLHRAPLVLSGLMEQLHKNLAEPSLFSPYTEQVIWANVAGGPLWVGLLRLWWLGLVLGVGGPLVLLCLPRSRPFVYPRDWLLGGLLGVAIATTLATLAAPAGEQFHRAMWLAPVFTVPGLLFVMQGQNRFLCAVVAASLTLLAFPTFLAHNEQIASRVRYGTEALVARFKGQKVDVRRITYTSPGVEEFLQGVEPDSQVSSGAALHLATDSSAAFDNLGGVLRSFLVSEDGIYVFSRLTAGIYSRIWAIRPDDRRWDVILSELDGRNQIYDNGGARVYAPSL